MLSGFKLYPRWVPLLHLSYYYYHYCCCCCCFRKPIIIIIIIIVFENKRGIRVSDEKEK